MKKSASVLETIGGKVTLKRYPGMPHTIHHDEIAEARRMLL